MVYAFIIHTLSAGPCRVLFSAVFAHESLEKSEVSDDTREKRKELLLQVANRVQSEFSFRYVAAGTKPSIDNLGLSTTEELLSQLESGVFRLTASNPFQSEKIVVWKGLSNCGFTLVCEKTENRLVAENVLILIIRYLQEYCHVILQPTEVILKPDKVTAVLHQFLPNGQVDESFCESQWIQLLFMNHRFVRQLEKELEQIMSR